MSNMRWLVAIAVVTWVMTSTSTAASSWTAEVPPDVVSVATGGYWEHAGRSGTFRVVLLRGGFEHVVSSLRAEWVAEPSSSEESPTIVHRIDLFSMFLGYLDAPIVSELKSGVRVTINGENRIGGQVSCVVDLLPNYQHVLGPDC